MNLPEEKRCPNCLGELSWIVTRKRVCPSCRKPIYMAFNPDDERKYAITAKEAKAFKEMWTEQLRQARPPSPPRSRKRRRLRRLPSGLSRAGVRRRLRRRQCENAPASSASISIRFRAAVRAGA